MESRKNKESAAVSGGSSFKLEPKPICNEDIIFCVDVDRESLAKMKAATGPNGKPLTRLDAIKQAILLFIHSKLSINPHHRFAFATLSNTASWLRKEFSSDIEAANAALRGLSATSSYGQADLTLLFQMAAHEAVKFRSQNRIVRVVLIYCRSSVRPHHQWHVNQKSFTMDVIYLHDKPGPNNCAQEVFDALVDSLEQVTEYDGYIYESGQGLARVLFKHISILLCHPQQRCPQDDLGLPKSISKRPPTDAVIPIEDVAPGPSQ